MASQRLPFGVIVASIGMICLQISRINAFNVGSSLHPSKQRPFSRASAFVPRNPLQQQITSLSGGTKLQMIYAPPGSGYKNSDDEVSELPDSYDPMMEYPGTMRPGRTPENMPFHDLPIGDDDPEPVPWPHFQQIQWHHRWDPPHPHPVPMEEFIEQVGRWATPEQEAEFKAGTRRASRARKALQEESKRDALILDDDDDDEVDDFPQDLGEGIFGQLGSTADQKITAEATSPDKKVEEEEDVEEDEDFEDDAGLDDLLLDLGLDSLDDEDAEDDGEEDEDDEYVDDIKPASKPPPKPAAPEPKPSIKQRLEDVMIADEDEDEVTIEDDTTPNPDVTASIDVEEDDDIDIGLDDEEDLDDSMEVPLEDFGDDDDSLDTEDFFDDGGFDYDDGDFDGGDFDGF